MHTLLEPGERGYLLTNIGRLLYRAFEQRAEAHGYVRVQWTVLAHLNRSAGMTQAQLAQLMEVEPITLSRHLDRMEQDRAVERRGDPRDKRVKRLHLTARGQEQLAELKRLRDDVLAAVFAGVPAEQEETFKKVLDDIRRNLMDKVS